MIQAFIFQRLWEPASVISMDGVTTTVWRKDVMMYIEEILALLFLFIMAGVIYLFDIYVFNSRAIKYENKENQKSLGDKK